MTFSSLAGMHIQFRTLTFYSRPEEQLQERLRLKKSMTLLSAVIRALVSPLGPYSESDLATDLYSGFTLIADMDESDRQISFSRLKKFVTSFPAAIGILCSSLGPHSESDLVTNIYAASTPIVNMDEFGRRITFNLINKSTISL
jgi:hypothetical protein